MKTKEEVKEWYHQRYLRNREQIKKRCSEYAKNHRERRRELEKQRRDRDPEKNRAYNREYARKFVLRVNGSYQRVEKRPYPTDGCEICKKQRQLVWHHWSDSRPELGLWLCRGCHFKAEDIERGWFISYLSLKEEICKNKG